MDKDSQEILKMCFMAENYYTPEDEHRTWK